MTTQKPDDRVALTDSRVDAEWRAASTENPPAALDASILAAARREVGAGPQRHRTRGAHHPNRHWWPVAAAATVAAVAVGVLQLTTPDQLGAPAPAKSIVTDVPAPVAAPLPRREEALPRPAASVPEPFPAGRTKGSASVEPQPKQVPAPAPAEGIAALEKRQHSPPPAAAAADAPIAYPPPMPDAKSVVPSAPQPMAAEATAAQTAATDRVQATPESAPARREAVAKLAAGSIADNRGDQARAGERAPLPDAEWIALIRRLRAEGKTADAARELAAFRAAHADHERRLPPDLRDWRPVEK